MTDKLTTLTTNVARLLDGALALPGDADREQAAVSLADSLITEAIVVLPGAVEPMPQELHIGGFTIGYCDDGSAYLEADNRPGEDGVSVRIDNLSAVLSGLYVAAKADAGQAVSIRVGERLFESHVSDADSIDALDLPDGDLAAKVIAREQNLEADNDCGDACKI